MKLEDFKKLCKTPEQEMCVSNCVGLFITGSRMYGTVTPESDFDYTAIFIPNKTYVYGRKICDEVDFNTNPSNSGHRNTKDDVDCKFYSLNKWISLAENNNPNILELFFIPQNCILYLTDLGKELLDSYKLFCSLKIYFSFRGYAVSQKNRLFLKSGHNTGRKNLQELYGYDTKLAQHNLRLYMECVQLLKEGRIDFPLAENKTLLDVKNGKWKLEEFIKESERLSNLCDACYANSTLQKSPNHEEIGKLQMKLFEKFWDSQL